MDRIDQTGALGENLLDEFRPAVDRILQKLIARDDVEGVALLGGVGKRQYIDRFSDLDFAVFTLTNRSYALPPFSFHLRHGDREIEINMTQQLVTGGGTSWSFEKRRAYGDAILIFDRSGVATSVIANHLGNASRMHFDETVRALNQIFWRGVCHSCAASARGFPESAHCLINEAVALAIKAHFHINEVDIPHTKWWIDALDKLPQKIDGARERLARLLLVQSLDAAEIEQRASLMKGVLTDLVQLAAHKYSEFPRDCYRYWARYLSDRQFEPEHIVDAICDQLDACLPSTDVRRVRGALSMSMLSDPPTVDALFSAACVEDPGAGELLERSLEILRSLPALESALLAFDERRA